MDDADPAYAGKDVFDDTVTLLDGQGKQQWQRGGMNVNVWLQSHGIAKNPADHSLWLASNGLTKLKSDGTVELTQKDVKANALAVDPKTGNVWVLTSAGTIYGDKLMVFDNSGKKVREAKSGG